MELNIIFGLTRSTTVPPHLTASELCCDMSLISRDQTFTSQGTAASKNES